MATMNGSQVSMSMDELKALLAKGYSESPQTETPKAQAPKTAKGNGKSKAAAVAQASEFTLPAGVTRVDGGYSIFVPDNARFHVSKSGKSEVHRIEYTCGKGTPNAISVFGYFNRPL